MRLVGIHKYKVLRNSIYTWLYGKLFVGMLYVEKV